MMLSAMPEIQIGATREEIVQVGNENAIKFLGTDGPRVLSTPHMIAFMERTSRNLVLPMLDPGQDTVGTHVNVSHSAVAPMGSSVRFLAEVTAVNGRRLEFRVRASMGDTVIGEGTHQRAVIQVSSFADRVKQAGQIPA